MFTEESVHFGVDRGKFIEPENHQFRDLSHEAGKKSEIYAHSFEETCDRRDEVYLGIWRVGIFFFADFCERTNDSQVSHQSNCEVTTSQRRISRGRLKS